MASALILDKCETGDFPAWLRTFECCANANKWSAEDKLAKLPVFLRGPAAAHFHGLTEAQKESYANLIKHLKDALCPHVDREKFYSAFNHRKWRPDEEPSILLWDLEDLLSKADPDLSAEARTALLERQFMKICHRQFVFASWRVTQRHHCPTSVPSFNATMLFITGAMTALSWQQWKTLCLHKEMNCTTQFAALLRLSLPFQRSNNSLKPP